MSVPLAVLVVFAGMLLALWLHDLHATRKRSRKASEALHQRHRIGL